MTLRLRLVLALVVLLTVGLGVFGFATYGLYSRSAYRRLDDQVRSSVGPTSAAVVAAAGLGGRPGDGERGGGGTHGPEGGEGPEPVSVPPAAYAELRNPSDKVLSRVRYSTSSQTPKLPTSLQANGPGRFFTTGSVKGSGAGGCMSTRAGFPPGDTVIVAVPTGEVTSSLRPPGPHRGTRPAAALLASWRAAPG